MATTLEELASIAATLPDAEQLALLRIAETMAIHPALRAAFTAPSDDEPITEEDRHAISEAIADPRPSIAHEELPTRIRLRVKAVSVASRRT